MSRLKILFALLILIPMAPAETIDELRARLVASGTVKATAEPQPAGVAVAFNNGNADITVNEFHLPVIVTINDAEPPALRQRKMLITVYNYNDATEQAFVTDTGVRNYLPVFTDDQLLERGRLVLGAMIANGIPVPATPTDTAIGYLSMKCVQPAWVGKTIIRYSRSTIKARDGSRGIYLYVYTDDGNGGSDRNQAWIRYDDDTGVYIIDAWE